MAELKPNYGSFVLRGIVGGTQREKYYTNGSTEKGKWQRLNFSVKVNDNASTFVELMGFKGATVQFVNDEDKQNKKYIDVPWKDRYKERTDNYKLNNAVKVGLTKEENSDKNKVNTMTSYDAVDFIKNHLKEGDSVYIRGQLQITAYEGKPQQKFIIQQIYHTAEPVDFNAKGYEPEASFNHEIVYVGSDYDEETNRTIINTYIIYKDNDKNIKFTPYMFFVNHEKYKNDEEKSKAIAKLRDSFENLPFGSTIRVNGNINIYIEKTENEEDADEVPEFGGFTAKGQEAIVRGTTIRELEITGGDGRTLIRERYSEDDFLPEESPFGSEEEVPFGNPDNFDEDELPFN